MGPSVSRVIAPPKLWLTCIDRSTIPLARCLSISRPSLSRTRFSVPTIPAERRLDEAEQVVLEAMSLPARTASARGNGFSQLLEQIHALQKAP